MSDKKMGSIKIKKITTYKKRADMLPGTTPFKKKEN
jgi:hypothetical protein